MAQEIINYGNVPNDGTGDPLRTAFIKTDDNFDQIWAAGPVGSNVTILNNTIAVSNTNGNLILAPNGIGVVQVNNHVLPRANRVYDLGSSSLQYRALYANSITAGALLVSVNMEVLGGLTVAGNLTVEGDTIQIGNIVTDTKTIQLANTAQTANAANLSGITVGANDNIATLLYNAADNAWTTNIGVSVTGNVTGNYILGNAAFMTGLPVPYGNSNVVALLSGFGSNSITTTGNVSSGNLSVSSGSNTWTISGQFITGPGGAYWHSHPEQQVSEFVSAPGEFVSIISRDANNVTQAELYLGNTYAEIFVENGTNHRWRFDESGVLEASGDIIPVTPGSAPADLGSQASPWTDAYVTGTISAGNIIPVANATQSLGNVTNQWANLWVANNTIYIGGVPLGVTGNVLTVNGEPVLSNDSDSSISTTGNITANAILTDNYRYANGEPFVSSSTGNITFSNTTMSSPVGDDLFITAANAEVEITGLDFRVEVTDDVRIQGNDVVSIRNTSNNEAITIRTDYNGNDYSWEFDATGNLTAPGSITLSGDITVAGHITGTSAASTLVLAAEPNSNTAIQLNDTVDSIISTVANLEVRTDVPNTSRLWRFDTNGDLTVPNYINFKDGTFIGDEGGAGTPVFRVDSPLGLGINLTTDSDISGNNYTWQFGIDGNLTLPSQGNIVGTTPNNSGSLQWVGNSSGDGYGYTTLVLRPDDTVSLDQSIVIDPTAPNHIHIRAGGPQDDSGAQLYLGGENSHFSVGSGSNPPLYLKANSYQWTLGTDGVMYTPGDIVVAGDVQGVSTNDSTAPQAVTVAAGDNTSGDLFNAANGANLTLRGGDSGMNPGGIVTIRGGNGTFDGNVVVKTGGSTWTFDNAGNLTLPGNTFAVNYANGTAIGIGGSYGNADVVTLLSDFGSNTISTTGNVTAGVLISSGTIYGNPDLILGNIADASGTKTRITSFGTNSYIQTGNGTVGSTGNIVFAPYLDSTEKIVIDTASGNVTAQNFVGNITITGNVTGTSANVELVAGSYEWAFDDTGNLTLPGNTFAVNYADGTAVDPVTRFTGSWSVTPGTANYNFTVFGGHTYTMWVNGNIPNGIIVWNATATVTNTNVPVIGTQYAWYYPTGNALVLNSIPSQIIGTAGTISNTEPAVANTNVFTFSITNNSGSTQIVDYGWIRIS